MIKLSFLGDIMCLKAQNDAVMKKHGEYRYDGYLSGLAPLLKDSNLCDCQFGITHHAFPLYSR